MDFFELNNKNIGLSDIVPEFLASQEVSKSRIGTLTHLVLQKIDFNKINNEEDVKDFIQYLVSKNLMTSLEANDIDCKKIFEFLNSEFALNIKKSRKVFKEKTFCTRVPANKIFKEATSEKLLVQGIIDLYYENENGNIVLIDYKTDYVPNNDETILINKYKTQLEMYKLALELGTKKKVQEVYIYSLYLNKAIKLF